MASYEIRFTESARRELRSLQADEVKRIWKRINALAKDPRPVGCVKLKGQETYRVRQGAYRILYEIHDGALLVLLLKIGHRREVYD